MSRSTTALKRLGVAGLATVTIGAGIPAFFATAATAAAGDTLTLTPASATAPTGSCTIFDATYSSNQPASSLSVQLTPRSANQDVAFCTVETDKASANFGEVTVLPELGAAGQRETAVFVDDGTPPDDEANDGIISFGVFATELSSAGTTDILAILNDDAQTDVNGSLVDSGNTEASDTSTLLFTRGGDVAAETVDATPEQAFAAEGDTASFDVVVKDANGRPLPGVQVEYVVRSGVDAGDNGTCADDTDNNGVTTCEVPNNGGQGTDNIRFFVDNGTGNDGQGNPLSGNGNFDSGEPFDDVTATFVEPTPAGTTVTLTCADRRSNGAGTTCQAPTSDTTQTFSALVEDANGDPVSGAVVNFDLVDTTNDADDTETLEPRSALTNSAGIATTTLTDTKPTDGETFDVIAEIQTAGGGNEDSTVVFTYRDAEPSEARNIVLTPESATKTVGDVQAFTATVTDGFGNPVKGVEVRFTENGTGRFTNGGTTQDVDTDANGVARVEVTSNQGEEPGSNTITATINDPRIDGASNDECELARNRTFGGTNTGGGGTVSNNNAVTTAGNCSDSSSLTFVSASPSPTATATSTTTATATATATSTATPPACTTAQGNLPVRFLAPSAKINANGATGPTVNATALVNVSVTGATPGSTVQLEAYQQNPQGTANFANAGNTRTAVADSNGVATFQVRFSSNARARAKQQGCTFGSNAGFNQGSTGANSNVLYVRTVITFTVTRVGTRTVSIVGDSIPARPAGLIVNINCSAARCSSPSNPNGILLQPRANPVNGEFGPVRYTFAPAFQNNRVNLYAATGVQETGEGDAQNVAGRSNNRNLLVF